MNAAANIFYIHTKLELYLLLLAAAAFCLLSGAYVYLLSMSVVHVVASKDIEERIHAVHGEIATLEAAYMEKQHAISNEVIKHRGFADADRKIFLDRETTTVVTRR